MDFAIAILDWKTYCWFRRAFCPSNLYLKTATFCSGGNFAFYRCCNIALPHFQKTSLWQGCCEIKLVANCKNYKLARQPVHTCNACTCFHVTPRKIFCCPRCLTSENMLAVNNQLASRWCLQPSLERGGGVGWTRLA